MHWSFTIGKFGGTELRVHATFFLLLAWVTFAAWISGGPQEAFWNAVLVLAVFTCVVLHEFGHAMMARHFGIRTPDITLLPIGGMARLERMPEDPKKEIMIALAGPAVNVAIWFIILLIAGVGIQTSLPSALDDTSAGFWTRLAAVNLLLVLFNMIPAFPMDGGRVFRATVAYFTNRAVATRVAAQLGQILAFAFGLLGLLNGNPILVLIAVFVFLTASSENSEAELRDVAHRALARDAVITSFEALTPEDSLASAAQALIRTTQSEFPVVGKNGRLAGMLTRSELLKNSHDHPEITTVEKVMVTNIPTVFLTSPMDAVLDAFQTPGVPAVAVSDSGGRFIGYITRENIGEWFILSRRTNSKRQR